MYSFKRTLVNTDVAIELEFNLHNKKADYKQRTKELLEEFDVIYIVADGKGVNDYEIIKANEEDKAVLIINYAEYEEISSKKPLQKVLYSKKIFDLRRK